MDTIRIIRFWKKRFRKSIKFRFLILWIILYSTITSCDSDPYGSHWMGEDKLTICQYLESNQEEFSKFYRLLAEGRMLTTLCAYNPYGEGYTLFLPTNEAVDNFIQQSQDYGNFEELLQDTSFIYELMRYHTIKRMVHTNEFPFGALRDSTLTGERLSIGFYSNDDIQSIKINNSAQVIRSNMEMTNGFIHVISGVLQQVKISGYDWLQQQDEYSILASAMELSGIRNRLWWSKYTILAEPDRVYHKYGIYSIDDLTSRISTPGMSYTNRSNSFYKFVGYHLVGGEYYLNELHWGNRKYTTLDSNPLTIEVGLEIKINPGIDDYGNVISESGDTTIIDYIQPVWDNCNIITNTGPVHSISDVLFYLPLPE